MGAIEAAAYVRRDKRERMLEAVENLKQTCGKTCDYCPIVRLCESQFRRDPRDWTCVPERRTS